MRTVGLAMFAALVAGGAMAQTVSKPAATKPVVTKPQGVAPGTTAPVVGQQKLLLEQQKAAAKDAREDRKLSDAGKSTALAAKPGKIGADNSAINAGKQEAKDKADAAMNAATTEIQIGIASGAVQAGAGAKDGGVTGGGKAPATAAPIKPCKGCPITAKPH